MCSNSRISTGPVFLPLHPRTQVLEFWIKYNSIQQIHQLFPPQITKPSNLFQVCRFHHPPGQVLILPRSEENTSNFLIQYLSMFLKNSYMTRLPFWNFENQAQKILLYQAGVKYHSISKKSAAKIASVKYLQYIMQYSERRPHRNCDGL